MLLHRFVYLLRLPESGNRFFFADSESLISRIRNGLRYKNNMFVRQVMSIEENSVLIRDFISEWQIKDVNIIISLSGK